MTTTEVPTLDWRHVDTLDAEIKRINRKRFAIRLRSQTQRVPQGPLSALAEQGPTDLMESSWMLDARAGRLREIRDAIAADLPPRRE